MTNIADFKIENNVIKGKSFSDFNLSAGIGKTILNVFNKNSKHVSQIDSETGKQTTFEEMKDSSVRCALWLKSQKIGIGDSIGVCADIRTDNYIPFLATFYNGAIISPCDHETTLTSARYYMKLIQPKIVFSINKTIETLMKAANLENVNTKFVVFDDYPGVTSLKDILLNQSVDSVRNYEPEQIMDAKKSIAFILFTSGSTGNPKGVAQSYEALSNNIVVPNPFVLENKVFLWYSQNYWITGLLYTLYSILNESLRIVHKEFDVDDTSKIIEKYKVNYFFGNPTMIARYVKSKVLSLKKYHLESLKIFCSSGSKLDENIIEKFRESLPHAFVCNSFGSTEVCGFTTAQTEHSKIPNSIGFVLPNVEIKIISETKSTLGANEIGEIYVKKPLIMLGYYKNSEATKEAVDDGWFLTGDLGYYTNEGEIVIVDRIKDVFVYQNHEVSPTEIESVLLKHPDVLAAVVVPVPHEIDENRPMAFIKKVPNSNLTEEELIKLSYDTLGKYKTLVGGVKFIDSIPVLPSGKVSRKKCKEMANAYAQNFN